MKYKKDVRRAMHHRQQTEKEEYRKFSYMVKHVSPKDVGPGRATVL